ncbi:ribosome maturation factor RimM [Phytoactinopolyspora limicola]|uniref:ribosome maturation factor RimM n=1 Tax=Phytoactinopolyspora limicola TaxID=2715536 RepID=UPI00140ADA1D
MFVTVGTVGRPHGVRGEVAVQVHSDSPEERFAPDSVLRIAEPGPTRTLTVLRCRWHQQRLLVQFAGVADRTAAEALRGIRLEVEVGDDEAPPGPDEYYDRQLVGLRVVTVDGAEVGTVSEIRHGLGQDILAVAGADGTQILVPFVTQIVPEIDVPGGRVVVDPPPGLLDLARSSAPEEPS